MARQNPAAAFDAGILQHKRRLQPQNRRQPVAGPGCRRPGNPDPKRGRKPRARHSGAPVASAGRGTCGR